jgi:hypothetical protein
VCYRVTGNPTLPLCRRELLKTSLYGVTAAFFDEVTYLPSGSLPPVMTSLKKKGKTNK